MKQLTVILYPLQKVNKAEEKNIKNLIGVKGPLKIRGKTS